MTVSDAVASRRSIRAFLPDPVPRGVLERVLGKARRAPSGGNLQPWHAVVLTGAPLARLLEAVAAGLAGGAGRGAEYDIYPPGLSGVYEERRVGVGEAMYAALAISREDRPARRAWFANNFRAFGAPVLMLVHTPRIMGPPQWSDIGMWLQTVMLLLREEGLDSCPQESWAMVAPQIRASVAIPDDHVLFCGMAIGRRDPQALVNTFEVPRASLEESIIFSGF